MEYKAYHLANYKTLPQIKNLDDSLIEAIEVVGNVLPFKVNNYVVEQLIDWKNVPEDPIYVLTFPQREMLLPDDYELMKQALKTSDRSIIHSVANEIRMKLNPHPAGQLSLNVPSFNETKLQGMQHKYKQTVLFFPSQGQTCHAYCTFCFRWPQFVGMNEYKFAMKETEFLIEYLREHSEVTDLLFTGGDPLIMKSKLLTSYILPIVEAKIPNLKTIRIGSKALAYWPYKFTTDEDAEETISLFKKIVDSKMNLSLMAHFNHPAELKTDEVVKAIKKIKQTGTVIRTQSPLIKHVNDSSEAWAEMWRLQVDNGCIPYYMFLARDTGAQHYFGLPLVEAWNIFRNAYQKVSGICRTVRGPSMSCVPGKVQVLGVSEVNDTKVIVLRMIQGRNPDWVAKPFFAKYDEKAVWMNELVPAFGEEKFFFEEEMETMYHEHIYDSEIESLE